MKVYGRSGGVAPLILLSAPDGDKWSAAGSYRFTPGERTGGTH